MGLITNLLNSFRVFLSNRKYRTKINSSFSEFEHLFMAESDGGNYADDTTLYVCEKNI